MAAAKPSWSRRDSNPRPPACKATPSPTPTSHDAPSPRSARFELTARAPSRPPEPLANGTSMARAIRGVQVSRRSLLSREAGSLVAHTKVLRLLVENAGRSIPPEVSAALLTVEGWAVAVVATEINEPQLGLEDEDSSILMAEIRSTLAIMPDRKLEPILRDLPYRRLYTLLYEVYRDYREDK